MIVKKEVVVAHGGQCPKGFIYDHNKGSTTYGKCVPLSSGTLAKKPKITKKLGSYA